MNTATSDRLIATTVKPTSRTPAIAASNGLRPRSMWRAMFSITTTASSTTKPVAMVSAISDRLFRLNPSRCMTAKLPASDTGTTTAGMSVARALRRNRNTTRMTSPTAIASAISTSCSALRIVTALFDTTWSVAEAGRLAASSGSSALTRSTVSITLLPGRLNTTSSTVGWPLVRPRLRTSCTESATVATSPRRTAAPPL
jgi:hypothetical protein